MNAKLRNHVDILFAAAPRTNRAAEMKEELLVNLNEKYDDLLREGYDTTTAFHIALSGIGDLDELLQECSQTGGIKPLEPRVFKTESIPVARPVFLAPKPSRMPLILGLVAGLVVGLPILALAVVPLFVVGNVVGLGVFGMFFCLAVAEGLPIFLIVYLVASLCMRRTNNQEQYQRLLLAQGEEHGLSQEFVQSELQRIGNVNKLRQVMLVLAIVFLSIFICSFVFGIPRIFPAGMPCRMGWFGYAIVPTGPVVIEERDIGDLSDLDIIDIHSAVSVEFKLSDRDYVTVETHEEMMPTVDTKINNRTLLINQYSSVPYRNVKKLLVTVHSRNVPKHLFQVSGASRLTCDEPLKVESISLYADGASKLHFKNIESTGSVNFKIDGASTVEIAGKAESVFARVSGASKLLASDFETDSCDTNLSGASRAEIGVINKELSVCASGTSRFNYRGTPTIKKQEVSGVSKISTH